MKAARAIKSGGWEHPPRVSLAGLGAGVRYEAGRHANHGLVGQR